MNPRVIPACAIALAFVILAMPAHAQDEAFRAGLSARDSMNWQEVARQMRRAIATNPQESARRIRGGGLGGVVSRLGGGGTEYLPHYLLGEALFKLGDCSGAVGAWSTSEQQGIVRVRADFLKELQSGIVACEARGVLPPGKFDPLVASTRQQIIDVNGLAENVSNLGRTNPDLWLNDAKEQYERATNEIQSARSQLEAAERSRNARDFQGASGAADRARGVLVALTRSLNTVIETRRSIDAQAQEVDQLIDRAEADDRDIDRRKGLLTPSLSAIRQSAREGIAGALERLSGGRAASNAPMLTDARMRVVDASSKLTQVLDELTRLERAEARQRVTVAQAAAQEALSLVDDAFATLNERMAKQPDLVVPDTTTQLTVIQRDLAAIQRRVDAAGAAQNVGALQNAVLQATAVRDRVNALIVGFGPLPIASRVHPVLFEGARLFFAGEYRSMLAALEPLEGGAAENPLQLHVHLFRAAALFSLFVASRETEGVLRTQAIDEVVRCKQLDPGFQPDSRAFGPRFLSFYQGVGVNQGQSAAPTVSAN